jgi:hypothetical protein
MRKVETRKLHRKRPDDRSEIATHDLEEDGAPPPGRQAAVPLESAQSTYGDVDDFAREMLKTKRGIGMTPPFHDQVVDLRNKRFAHHDEHHSVSNALEVAFEDNRFEIKFGISLGYHIGGAKEWPDLVNSVEAIYLDRIDKLLTRLKLKTGHDWALQSGPAPEEIAR